MNSLSLCTELTFVFAGCHCNLYTAGALLSLLVHYFFYTSIVSVSEFEVYFSEWLRTFSDRSMQPIHENRLNRFNPDTAYILLIRSNIPVRYK